MSTPCVTRIWVMFLILQCLFLIYPTPSSACENSLLQIATPNAPSQELEGNDWVSSRLLATIPQVHLVRTSSVQFTIFSAVPVFGPEDSYIALLTERKNDIWMKKGDVRWPRRLGRQMFCSGPDRSHLSPAKYRGSVVICDWPREEQNQTSFQISLEDSNGTILANIVASHDPALLQQYTILACVRDTFNDPHPVHEWQGRFSGVFKQLAEWLEWSLMHGTSHFMFYTFKGVAFAEKDILNPYLDAGLATRVHFDIYPEDSLVRFGYAANDCLYRSKHHARWLLTNVDMDEYIVLNRPFRRTIKPKSAPYEDTCHEDIRCFDFDALMKATSDLPRERVRSMRIKRVRFGRAQPTQLEISSVRREGKVPRTRPVKHIINVDVVSRLSVHGVVTYDDGTVSLSVKAHNAVIHHYRLPYDLKVEYEHYDFSDPEANATDRSLLPDISPLTEAIQRRFSLGAPEEVSAFLETLIHKPLPMGK